MHAFDNAADGVRLSVFEVIANFGQTIEIILGQSHAQHLVEFGAFSHDV